MQFRCKNWIRCTVLLYALSFCPISDSFIRADEPSAARRAEPSAAKGSEAKGSDEGKKNPFRTGEEMQQWIERISGIRFSQTNQRDHESVKSAFQESVKEARHYTVRIFANDDQVALGTIVDSNGYILTKASELTGKLKLRLWDGRRYPAEIVGVNREYDIAILKIDATKLPVVKWRTGESPVVGSWLATVGQESVPEAIGVVSAAPRKVIAPKGMLGVILEEDPAGARVSQVMPGSTAERIRMQLNDVVTHINGKPVTSRQMLVESIQKFAPGDIVDLKLRRDNSDLALKATLGDRSAGPQSERTDFQNSLGGKLSDRRAGFPMALQHDTVLRPNLCGGPVVDLDGKVVGINIARAGRVASYALPGEVVWPLLDELKSGKLAPEIKTMLVDTQKTDSE